MISLAGILALKSDIKCLPKVDLVRPILRMTRFDHIRALGHHTLHVEVPSVDRRCAKFKLLFSLTTRGNGRILDRMRGSQRLVRPGAVERANLGVVVCGDRLSLCSHEQIW